MPGAPRPAQRVFCGCSQTIHGILIGVGTVAAIGFLAGFIIALGDHRTAEEKAADYLKKHFTMPFSPTPWLGPSTQPQYSLLLATPAPTASPTYYSTPSPTPYPTESPTSPTAAPAPPAPQGDSNPLTVFSPAAQTGVQTFLQTFAGDINSCYTSAQGRATDSGKCTIYNQCFVMVSGAGVSMIQIAAESGQTVAPSEVQGLLDMMIADPRTEAQLACEAAGLPLVLPTAVMPTASPTASGGVGGAPGSMPTLTVAQQAQLAQAAEAVTQCFTTAALNPDSAAKCTAYNMCFQTMATMGSDILLPQGMSATEVNTLMMAMAAAHTAPASAACNEAGMQMTLPSVAGRRLRFFFDTDMFDSDYSPEGSVRAYPDDDDVWKDDPVFGGLEIGLLIGCLLSTFVAVFGCIGCCLAAPAQASAPAQPQTSFVLNHQAEAQMQAAHSGQSTMQANPLHQFSQYNTPNPAATPPLAPYAEGV